MVKEWAGKQFKSGPRCRPLTPVYARQKCLAIDPKQRLTPEQGLKHSWIRRSKLQSVFKENMMTNKVILKDLADVIRPLPSSTRERLAI